MSIEKFNEHWWHTHIFMPGKQEMDEQVETVPFLYNNSVRSVDPFCVQFLVHSGLCDHKSFRDIRLVCICIVY